MKHSIFFSLVLSFFLVIFSANAQQLTFEYILRSDSDKTLDFSDIIEAPSNSILFCGSLSNIGIVDSMSSYIVKINECGIFLDSLLVKNNLQSNSCHSLINYSNDTLLTLSSVEKYANGESSMVFSLINDSLMVLDTSLFILPIDYKLRTISVSKDNINGRFLVNGAFRKNGQNITRPFVYVLDNMLDSLIGKYYSDLGGFASKIKYLPSNQYWICRLPSEYWLLDSLLNLTITENVPYNLSGNIGVEWDTDTSFYLVGSKLSNPNHNLGFIRQNHPIDTEGYLYNQWGDTDTLDFPAYVNGIDFKNKDSIFIGGTHNMDYYNPHYGKKPSWFVVLQTDSMLNLRWERFYGGDAYYLMGKIIASNDGGCIIGGTRYDYLYVNEDKKDIIILKLNEDGLLVGEQETPSIEMHEAIVYPNPGTTEIKVRIAAQYKESLFQLFDLNGKQVASEKMFGKFGSINTNFLKSGTYIYRISSEDGLFESGKWVKQ